ncbi:hypothetical protein LOK49_LG03G03023 [Camellia lanceoleosa]|uniref:Uncharacterized protein n=1 Tax=Camellia lanceoleosa TaxID=1840588 RepID=A0ACC0I906_9ERIC|nr:hypothetical protein LOK49_LG03G03023 [Camellia lanceoleosa]
MRTKSKLYYYFIELKKKNGKGKRIDRMVAKGTWKGLNRHKPIRDNEGRVTGRKRIFDYINRESSEHNVWDITEYSLEGQNYVLCAIKMKRHRAKIEQQEQPVDDSDIDHYSVEDDQPTVAVIQQEEQPTVAVMQQEEQPTTAFIQQELAPPDDEDHFDWD